MRISTTRLLLTAAVAFAAVAGSSAAITSFTCIDSAIASNGAVLNGGVYQLGTTLDPINLIMRGCSITGAPVTIVAASVEITKSPNVPLTPTSFTNAPLSIVFAPDVATISDPNYFDPLLRKLVVTDVVFEGTTTNNDPADESAMFSLDATNYAAGYTYASPTLPALSVARLANFDIRDNRGITTCIPATFTQLRDRSSLPSVTIAGPPSYLSSYSNCFRVGAYIKASDTDGLYGSWPAPAHADLIGLLFIKKYNERISPATDACSFSTKSAEYVITKTNTFFGAVVTDLDPADVDDITADVVYGLTDLAEVLPANVNNRDVIIGKPADDCANSAVAATQTIHAGRYVEFAAALDAASNSMKVTIFVEDYANEAVTVETYTAAAYTGPKQCSNRATADTGAGRFSYRFGTPSNDWILESALADRIVGGQTINGRTLTRNFLQGASDCGNPSADGGSVVVYVEVTHEELLPSGTLAATAVSKSTLTLFFSASNVGSFSVTNVANDLVFHAMQASIVATPSPHNEFPMQVCTVKYDTPPITYAAFESSTPLGYAPTYTYTLNDASTACDGSSSPTGTSSCAETVTLTIDTPVFPSVCLDAIDAKQPTATHCCRSMTIATSQDFSTFQEVLTSVPFVTVSATGTGTIQARVVTTLFLDFWTQASITTAPSDMFVKISAFDPVALSPNTLPDLALAGTEAGELLNEAAVLVGADVLFRFELDTLTSNLGDHPINAFGLDVTKIVACGAPSGYTFPSYIGSSTSNTGCAAMPVLEGSGISSNPNPIRETYLSASLGGCRDHTGDNLGLKSLWQCPAFSTDINIIFPTGRTASGGAKVSHRSPVAGVCHLAPQKLCQVTGAPASNGVFSIYECDNTVPGSEEGTCINEDGVADAIDGIDDAGIDGTVVTDWTTNQFCRKSAQSEWPTLDSTNYAACDVAGALSNADTDCYGGINECSARTDIAYARVTIPTFMFDNIEVPVYINFEFFVYARTSARALPAARRLLSTDENVHASAVNAVRMRHSLTIMPKSQSVTPSGAGAPGVYGAVVGHTVDGRKIVVDSHTGSVRVNNNNNNAVATTSAPAPAHATEEEKEESDWAKANAILRAHPGAVSGIAVAMIALGVAVAIVVSKTRQRVSRRKAMEMKPLVNEVDGGLHTVPEMVALA